ncbi:MAG: hypothetical protein V9G14_04915 [Cypionkella sp.]
MTTQGLFLRTTGLPNGRAAALRALSPACCPRRPDATALAPQLSLRLHPDHLLMQRAGENLRIEARRLAPLAVADGAELAGRYRSR